MFLPYLLLAACPQVNGNDVPPNNGDETFVFFSSPSVGSGLTGGFTPGDLFWKTLPGDRVLAAGSGTMEIDSFYEPLFDTDWATSPSFYDRMIGPALPSPAAAPCQLEPAFFQLGVTSETLFIIGSSGFGNPCTVVPSLCSPSGGTCPPSGFINGYIVQLYFSSTPGTGIVLPADGTSASAVTYFLPGGMVATGGTCGLGDYDLQAEYSTDETQFDDCFGVSSFSGFQLGTGGPVPDLVTDTPTPNAGFREPVLNVVADSGGGLGIETADNGGGALNALKLDTSGGLATIGFEIRDLAGGATPNVAFGAASTTMIGPPGIPVFGTGSLLIRPTLSAACFAGAVSPTVFVFTSEGAFISCQLPVSVSGPRDIYWQGLVLDLTTGLGRTTNRVRTSLF